MTCMLVLGHPRSGASLVAALLHNLGVYMNPTAGDEIGETFEDNEFGLLHEEMLGSWFNPAPYDFSKYHDRYEELIKERVKRSVWGYKNAGIPFVFSDIVPLIRKYDGDIRVVVVRRAAEESIPSLSKVNPGLWDSVATGVITRYMAAVDRAANRFNGPILTVSYRMILKTPKHHVERLAEFAGVDNDPGVCDIVKPALCHFKWEYLQ